MCMYVCMLIVQLDIEQYPRKKNKCLETDITKKKRSYKVFLILVYELIK